MIDYSKEKLEQAIEALEMHIKNQGGQVESSERFDPYKSSIASTNFQSTKMPSVSNVDSYDPSAVQHKID